MTTLKMRHFAILSIAAVSIAAMFNDITLTDLVPFYGIMSTIIVADKVNSMKNPSKQ